MSLLTATETRQLTLPRVNLLPPEIAEQRRFRRTQLLLAVGVISAVGVVGGVYALAAADVTKAEEQLVIEQSRSAELQSEADQYADVPNTYAQVDAKEAQVELAMGQEVRWSSFLNDLSRTIPDHVWIEQMTVLQDVDSQSAPEAAAVPTGGAYADPGLGQVSFTGKAAEHNDVAVWLETLAQQRGYTQPYVTSSEVTEIGEKEAVQYTSQATLTEDALSQRYTKGAQR